MKTIHEVKYQCQCNQGGKNIDTDLKIGHDYYWFLVNVERDGRICSRAGTGYPGQRASQLRKYSCNNKIGTKSFAMNIRHFQQ
jgi:hypothetical protein